MTRDCPAYSTAVTMEQRRSMKMLMGKKGDLTMSRRKKERRKKTKRRKRGKRSR